LDAGNLAPNGEANTMKTRLALTVALLALLPAAAAAQDTARPQTREGFGISFGGGLGSVGLSCDGCDFDRETAISGYLRLGGYVRPNLMIAGETNGWTKDEDGVKGTASFISAVALWYPQPASGFYLKGGLGFSNTTIEDGADEITAAGMGISLGLGYDWRLGTNFSLTPYMNWMKSFGAEAEFNGTGTGIDLNSDVLQIGLGFTWH
jgi:opacity protein-like surface antigen